MNDQECDVIVVGMGPGGEAVAMKLAEAGHDVVATEAELVGGECPYWGCIPSKMMIRAGNLLAEGRRIESMAGTATIHPDYSIVADRIRDEATDDWDDTVAADRLTEHNVRLVRGKGRLAGDRIVEVGDQRITARIGVVLNTGTTPSVPPIDGLADTPFWTNREVFKTTEAPKSMILVGGGAIGLELAQAFSRFGTKVTVIESAPRILGSEEPESSELITDVLRQEGLTIETDATIEHISHDGNRFEVACKDGVHTAERLLVATGRTARLADIGLETVGLDPSAKTLDVDDGMLAKDGLWAIGDMVGRGAFTHVSVYQAKRAVQAVQGKSLESYDSTLPRVTFTDPEVGAAGLTEEQARAAGVNVRIGTEDVSGGSRGWLHKVGNAGLIKLVIDEDRDVLVGATSIGPMGGETLSALAVAIRAEIPLDTLRNSVWPFPTFYQSIVAAL